MSAQDTGYANPITLLGKPLTATPWRMDRDTIRLHAEASQSSPNGPWLSH